MPTWWQETISWLRTFIRNLLSGPLRFYEPVEPKVINKLEYAEAAKKGKDPTRCKTYDPSYGDAVVQAIGDKYYCCPTGYTPVEVDGKVICRKG